MLDNFSIEDFKEIYSQYKDISDKKIEEAYTLACLLHKQNAKKEYIEDKNICKSLIYLLISHILGLYERGDRLVGSLVSASEGSISSSFSFSKNERAAWFCQSQSGASYYQLVQSKNLPRYYAGR